MKILGLILCIPFICLALMMVVGAVASLFLFGFTGEQTEVAVVLAILVSFLVGIVLVANAE